MNSRERVRRCLEFDSPDRVPRDTWVLPIARDEHGPSAIDAFLRRWPSDFAYIDVDNPKLAALRTGDAYTVGQFTDEWGCVFENAHAGIIGQVKQPLLDDWARLDDLRLPVEALEFDLDAVNRQCAATEQFTLAGCCPRPFERVQFLRGTENVFKDIARKSSDLTALLRRVHAFYCEELERWAHTDVDGLFCMDDWGTQDSLLISPRKWRELFKPLYRDYAAIAHAHDKKLLMHSDGHILAIYADLIEVGVDAINSQLFCMDISEIARRAKGRITFWGEIDRQHVLPAPAVEPARDAVREVARHLYDPAGGVIAQFELGGGARLENAEAIYETWEAVPQAT